MHNCMLRGLQQAQSFNVEYTYPSLVEPTLHDVTHSRDGPTLVITDLAACGLARGVAIGFSFILLHKCNGRPLLILRLL